MYLMQQYDLKVGETITVKSGEYEKQFVIADYARDYEMNSALTSSKRFVINPEDYNELLQSMLGNWNI